MSKDAAGIPRECRAMPRECIGTCGNGDENIAGMPCQSITLIERRSATKCRICICTFSLILTKFAEISIVTVTFVPELNGVSMTSHSLRFPLLYDLSKNQQSAKKLKKPTNIHFLVGLYRGAKQHNFFFWEFKDQHFRKLSKPLFCWSSYNIRNFVCGLVTSTFF